MTRSKTPVHRLIPPILGLILSTLLCPGRVLAAASAAAPAADPAADLSEPAPQTVRETISLYEPVCLTAEEEKEAAEFLAEACPHTLYAARVGMASVLLRRADEAGSVDEALRQLRAELAHDRSAGAAPLKIIKNPFRSMTAALQRRMTGLLHKEKDDRLRALCLNAVKAAEAGADVTGGAREFRIAEIPRSTDFLFDDSREDGRMRAIREELADYGRIIGNVGFR